MGNILKFLANHSPLGKRSFYRKWCRRHLGQRLQAETASGFLMDLTSGDSVANQLIVYGIFEPYLTELLTGFAKSGYSFVDVGCNVGFFSCLFAKNSPDQTPILAIDANPKMCEETKRNRDLNGYHFEVVQTALGDSEGEVTLSWPTQAVSHASVGRCEEGFNSVEVPMTTLPKLLKSHTLGDKRVLKIDIEGYEIPLLRSYTEKPPFSEILFEYCEENLAACGFTKEELFSIPWLKEYHLFGLSSKKGCVIPLKSRIPPHVDTIWARDGLDRH